MKKLSILLVSIVLIMVCVGCNKIDEPQQVLSLDTITVDWLGSKKEYVVGDHLTVTDYYLISELQKRDETLRCEYNEMGQILQVNVDHEDGLGYEKVTYHNGLPILLDYNLNDGFRSERLTEIVIEKDANNRVSKMTENNKFTDVEDKSVSYGVDVLELSYNEAGLVSSVDYYTKGKFDHTTKLTYDEAGNVLVYSNVSDDGREYLRVEFTYKLVDGIENYALDAFVKYYNLEVLINHIL